MYGISYIGVVSGANVGYIPYMERLGYGDVIPEKQRSHRIRVEVRVESVFQSRLGSSRIVVSKVGLGARRVQSYLLRHDWSPRECLHE